MTVFWHDFRVIREMRENLIRRYFSFDEGVASFVTNFTSCVTVLSFIFVRRSARIYSLRLERQMLSSSKKTMVNETGLNWSSDSDDVL